MKTTLHLISLLMIAATFISYPVKADDNWKKEAQKVLDDASKDDKNVKAWDDASATLQRMAGQHPEDWLIQYQAAFSTSLSAMRNEDMPKRDHLLEKAISYALKADQLKSNESEIVLLKGMITAMKISVDPAKRGQELGQEAMSLFEEARKLNPENPRVYLEMGESALYTPEQYGGGKEKAAGLLKMSMSFYAKWKSPGILYPSWGEERAKSIYNQCSAK